jgi:uncharacterized repeat protein (TIGR01451 family)
LLITAGAVASLLVAAVALALINDSGTYSIEVTDKSISSDLIQLTATPGDGSAFVKYIGSSAQDQASGTGLFDPFVRLQGSLPTAPTEKGYNTCTQSSCGGDVSEFETKTGSWTHAIKASAIPVVDCEADGDLTTTERCWELFNDINDGNSAKYISLTKVEIYFTQSANGIVTDYPFGSEATLQYAFNGEIKIHDVNQGSGRGDLLYLVPVQTFTANDWFVLYSEWGSLDTAPDGKNYASEGGFEEWKVRKTPNLSYVKTADNASVNAGQNIGFTITVTNTGVADATGVTISDPLPGGAGIDWAESPDNPNCSISGTPPAQETLNCGPVTLAALTGSLSVHVQSGTTAASCGTYNNTATFASTNAGSGSASASTSVNCAAIQILKQSTKTGNTLVTDPTPADNTDNAVFTVTPPVGSAFDVTDNGTGDEDSTYGEVCVSGLAPGNYTVTEKTAPAGYGSGNPGFDTSAVAATGTNCTLNHPTTANSAIFRNPPLGEIEVKFTDLGSGETKASIVCKLGTTTIGAVSENGAVDPAFDDIDETFTNLPPGTYDCQVVVDP